MQSQSSSITMNFELTVKESEEPVETQFDVGVPPKRFVRIYLFLLSEYFQIK